MDSATSDYLQEIRFSSPLPFHSSNPATPSRDRRARYPAPAPNLLRPFDEGLGLLEDITGLTLRDGQVSALWELYCGRDVLLVAKTGYGKTLVMTGYHALLQPGKSVTVILSPLKAIENGQAWELTERFDNLFKPFVLDGESNTPSSRKAIARGDYTHVWTSAEIAIGSLSNPNKSEKPRVTKTNPFPDFTAILQDAGFQDKLALVAIDEIHLCHTDSWGGSFRKDMGSFSLLRAQLNDHTRLFGTTATLTPEAWVSIRKEAGFREKDTCFIRTSIYRNDVFFQMLPSDSPRSVCKQLLYTAVDEMWLSESYDHTACQLPKIIFFMPHIRDTINLRDDIHLWLKEEKNIHPPKRIVSSYHGDMPAATRKVIEQKFDTGELRILCTTIAYALGVNPAGVKYVLQQGHCSTDEALQKLGRASRGANAITGAAFIWVPETKVVGLRLCDLPLTEQQSAAGRSKAKKPKPVYQNIPTWNSQSESESNNGGIKSSSGSKRKRALPKNASPALWRQERLQPGQYNVYNPPNCCYWAALLALYDEKLDSMDKQQCGNCSGCNPDYLSLAELSEKDDDREELPEIITFVRKRLDTLAVELGSNITSALDLACTKHVPVAERYLTEDYRKQFSQSYYRVARRGDLMGWAWTRMFGWDVVNVICTAIGEPTPLTLLGLPSTEEVAAWNIETPKPLTGRSRHPFDTSDKPLLPKSFFNRYCRLATPDPELVHSCDEEFDDLPVINEEEPVRRTARGAVSKPKKKL